MAARVNQVRVAREDLEARYRELLVQNPLLGRIEAQCRAIGWTDVEIRTMQLLTACASNASLVGRLEEMESGLRQNLVR